MKVQKIIANRGYTSRRNAEKLIEEGRVTINGKKVKIGDRANENVTIYIDDKPIYNEEKVYFLLNKPRGVLSTSFDEKQRQTVVDLIDTDKRIYPIGRLDYDTTGLIILTNDGTLTNILTHPKTMVPKTYLAKINKVLDMKEFHKIKDGITINGRKVLVTKLKIRKIDKQKNVSFIELTISEGRYHIVKRLFRKLGIDVIKLTRISFANLYIGNLQSGEYRRLKKKEIQDLYSYGDKK